MKRRIRLPPKLSFSSTAFIYSHCGLREEAPTRLHAIKRLEGGVASDLELAMFTTPSARLRFGSVHLCAIDSFAGPSAVVRGPAYAFVLR